MTKHDDHKRVFFGVELNAPWPEKLPKGRLLDEKHRHLTLAFLGNVDYPKLEKLLPDLPLPNFRVGQAACFDDCLFLPSKRPHVVAWHVKWLEDNRLNSYQTVLANWLRARGYSIDKRPFLPHVTLARSPFQTRPWQDDFSPLPVITSQIHLYQSVGGLRYEPIWTHALPPPFVEVEHTADIAFQINGESLEQLHLHALVALAFKAPQLLNYRKTDLELQDLDDVIIALNAAVTDMDAEQGCPLKAVSFHGAIAEKNGLFTWEMIADV